MLQSHIRWKRSVAAGLISALVAIVAAIAPPIWRTYRDSRPAPVEPVVPVVASDDEQQQIIVALFDQMRFASPPPLRPPQHTEPVGPSKSVAFVTTTFALTAYGNEPATSFTADITPDSVWLVDTDGVVSVRFRRELVAANPSARILACPASPQIRCTTLDAFNAVFRADGWWDAFYAAYPDTAGVVRASMATLSSDRATAVLYVSHRCAGLCGAGWLIVLKRSSAGWRIHAKQMTWIS